MKYRALETDDIPCIHCDLFTAPCVGSEGSCDCDINEKQIAVDQTGIDCAEEDICYVEVREEVTNA